MRWDIRRLAPFRMNGGTLARSGSYVAWLSIHLQLGNILGKTFFFLAPFSMFSLANTILFGCFFVFSDAIDRLILRME